MLDISISPAKKMAIFAPEPDPVFQVIEPTILSYVDAVQLRAYAESGADPYYYRMAAIAFDSLGMPSAAARLFKKATHYEGLNT